MCSHIVHKHSFINHNSSRDELWYKIVSFLVILAQLFIPYNETKLNAENRYKRKNASIPQPTPPPPPSPQLSFKTTKHVTFSNAHCTPEQGQASVSLYQEVEAEIHVYVRERGLISLGILYYSQ